jgi:hypothetical protein
MDELYTFVYKGILTDESLDKAGRLKHEQVSSEQIEKLQKTLSYEMLDQELIEQSKKMGLIYQAIYTIENMIRKLVVSSMLEKYGENWWEKISDAIKRKVLARQEEERKIKWHTSRGVSEVFYCDFGDLSAIICSNWDIFEYLLVNQEWTKQLLNSLEKSRNVIMHGGNLSLEDIERIGVNIRDWIRQTG